MSLPDGQLDEPSEPETCELHDEPRPCQHCRSESADREYEDWREER